ncbi:MULTISPECIES: PE-PGRS family protein [Spirosoma]|uniref:PE-PGRS family protein n=1 Tax=Spirosoma sordidisoli TaxID=2502893 RepID=A0A4Q2UX55_9BACT|nr:MULTISPECIES: PE-PGRS family protein [Spirosoma]RYC71609.1 PE-PGRS family protein [Spirosoma sordidisoli]
MRIVLILIGLLTATSCKLELPGVDQAQFADPTATPVQAGLIDEASGMVDSRTQPGNLWINQDSGSPAELALLGHDGQLKGRISVPRFENRDWEELASGPGPQDGVNYLYIGDIGDNNAQQPFLQVYRLPEPANLQTPITQIERINFRYPDGPRDAEAMFIDPATKDIYIISKREANVRLYRLPYPQNINELTVAESLGEIPMTFVTGAAISPDGSEIVVRTYTEIRYWKRNAGQSIADALQRGNSKALPYRVEPQGEAVCFDKDGKGYFTISEKGSASAVNLFYYARK